jgi:3'-phosphoadenosine 5'-phosphosulfate sulfotransferase (PAPS reductase)/FAD synthetase
MNIFEKQMTEGRIYSSTGAFKARVRKALTDLDHAFKTGPAYLALSWGKQSIILAHMIWTMDPEVPCVFRKNPLSDLINNFNEVRDNFLSAWKLNYEEFNGDTDLKRNGLRYMRDNGLQVVIMGLAADESNGRRMTLAAADRYNLFRYSNGYFRSCPLRNWKIIDIAAYTYAYDLPVLDTYKKFGFEARTSAGITPGTHAEQGIDLLSDEKQKKVREHYAL